MKKKDIIQLVKKTIKEVGQYQFGNRQGPSSFRTSITAPAGEDSYTGKNEYPFTVKPKRTSTGMMEEEYTAKDQWSDFSNEEKAEVLDDLGKDGRIILQQGYTEYDEVLDDIMKGDNETFDAAILGTPLNEENIKSFDPDTLALVREMLDAADVYHNDLVGGYDEPSSYLDKRTGGTIIKFPHFNGPPNPALFGKETVNKIDASKSKAKAAALKTYTKFKTYIEDYEISDVSPAGVYGNVYLFLMFNPLAKDYSAPKGGTQSSQFEEIEEAPLFRTGVKMDMAPEVMAPRIKKVFDKVNGAKDPVRTPEWHKNRFKNKYGISFPETLKGINKDQALAMNKYANDMSIRETKNIKEIGHLVTTKGGETKYMDIEPKVAQQMKGDAGVTGIETVTGTTIKEDDLELTNNIGKDDYVDDEGRMAKSQLYKAGKYAMKLHDMLDDMEQLPSWVQAKLTKASDYMSAVYHYLDYEFARRDSNLMEHVDKYKKRAVLMEGAMKKFFEMFDKGKTDEEIVQDYAHKGTTVPETFVTKARRQYEGMKKLKLELEMSEKEFRNSSEKMVNNAEEGMEPGMEEKKLASKLYNEEEVDEVSYDDSGLENPKAADISKDGDISDYELKRGKAIEKAIDKQKNK